MAVTTDSSADDTTIGPFSFEFPKTYLGHARSDQLPSTNGAELSTHRAYELAERLPSNQWAFAGTWALEPESVVLDQASGSIAYRFHAREAHLVVSRGAREAIPFRVLVDGDAPGRSPGMDVDEDGNGVLRDGRMYQLVREHDAVRERTLGITFLEPGAAGHAFTFG
jgi:hypothetical protein